MCVCVCVWLHNNTSLLFLFAVSQQRAKIGPSKTDGSSSNAISKFDSNGNRDRMKLSDFNFLMVLGKGSFGKVTLALVFRSVSLSLFVYPVGSLVLRAAGSLELWGYSKQVRLLEHRTKRQREGKQEGEWAFSCRLMFQLLPVTMATGF